MFDFRLRQRASISHESGTLAISIPRHPDHFANLVTVTIAAAGFCFICFFLAGVLVRVYSFSDGLMFLLLAALLGLPAFWLLRFYLLRAFGVEQVTVSRDTLVWVRTVLWWTRRVDAARDQITSIKAKTSRLGLNNHVEIVVRGKTWRIGDRLLDEETLEIARALNNALRV